MGGYHCGNLLTYMGSTIIEGPFGKEFHQHTVRCPNCKGYQEHQKRLSIINPNHIISKGDGGWVNSFPHNHVASATGILDRPRQLHGIQVVVIPDEPVVKVQWVTQGGKSFMAESPLMDDELDRYWLRGLVSDKLLDNPPPLW